MIAGGAEPSPMTWYHVCSPSPHASSAMQATLARQAPTAATRLLRGAHGLITVPRGSSAEGSAALYQRLGAGFRHEMGYQANGY